MFLCNFSYSGKISQLSSETKFSTGISSGNFISRTIFRFFLSVLIHSLQFYYKKYQEQVSERLLIFPASFLFILTIQFLVPLKEITSPFYMNIVCKRYFIKMVLIYLFQSHQSVNYTRLIPNT